MTDDPHVAWRDSKLLGYFSAGPPFRERQLHDSLFPPGQPRETWGETLHQMCPPRRFWRPFGCWRGLQSQPPRSLVGALPRASKRVRDVATHAEHVPIEEIEVVDSTHPQRCQRGLHDLLCQIFGFRYTVKMPQPVKARALPKPPTQLVLSGARLWSALLDTPCQLCIAGVLRHHRRSLPDLFL
jgi:hypothetical protein